jgi:inorganic pyrophosphatase
MNPADNELLDVILADPRPRARGERLLARVVDVLERRDGDHKLLAVPLDVSPAALTITRYLKRVRSAVWQWFVEMERPITRWAGENAALALITECRAATT